MSCPECGATFNVPQWRSLALADEQPKRASLERRICSRCGLVLATNPEGLDDMDCEMDARQYAMLWPHSELPALAFAKEAQQMAKTARRHLAIACALAALAAAALLAYLTL